MIGRCGRPGFDTEGVAVIMTNMKTKHLYEENQLLEGLEPVSYS